MADRILISHTGADRQWAEWARWHLEGAGIPTELDSVDWTNSTNFIEAMDKALAREKPLLVLLSSAYLDRGKFTTDEWTTRFAQRRRDPRAKLIAFRVEDVDLYGGIWAPIIVQDLFGIDAADAAKALLDTVRRVLDPEAFKTLPPTPPAFPGGPPPGPQSPS